MQFSDGIFDVINMRFTRHEDTDSCEVPQVEWDMPFPFPDILKRQTDDVADHDVADRDLSFIVTIPSDEWLELAMDTHCPALAGILRLQGFSPGESVDVLALTGRTLLPNNPHEGQALVFHGPPGTGKTVFCDVVRSWYNPGDQIGLMDSDCMWTPSQLVDKRIVILGAKMAKRPDLLKPIVSGGDYEFPCKYEGLLLTRGDCFRPPVIGTSNGIIREAAGFTNDSVFYVPFLHRPRVVDRELNKAVAAEAPWALVVCRLAFAARMAARYPLQPGIQHRGIFLSMALHLSLMFKVETAKDESGEA